MVSTEGEITERILKNIDFSKVKKFYDLGSGSGNVVSRIAREYPSLKCVGIEYNVTDLFWAKFKNIFSKNKVIYKKGDFFKTDISDADIIYVYLFPEIIERLEEKFANELKKGALVITNTFPLKFKKTKLIIPEKKRKLGTLYIYEY